MFVFSPQAQGSNNSWPTYITSGNHAQTMDIAAQQAWEQRGLVSIPSFGLAPYERPPWFGLRAANVGMGDASQEVSQGVSYGATTAGAALTLPAVQSALGISAAAAGFATLGIGAAAAAVIMWLNRKGPKQKIATTEIVNEAEPILKQNLQIFLAGEKTDEAKEYAIAVFNKVWASVVAACSAASLGEPGKRCVEDRQRGGKWDWFSYYYDPIMAVPTQPAAAVAVGNVTQQFENVLGGNWQTMLGAGLLLVGAVSLLDFGKSGR